MAGRERTVLVGGIAALALLAWAYLARGGEMTMAADFALVLAMWWVMMVAMMLPSAAPAILLYARVRNSRGDAAGIAPPWLFLSGYLITWLGFSLAAAAAQLELVRSDWIGAMNLCASAPALVGGALMAAGAYQLSPWKNACLRSCRSPAQFLTRYWRPGPSGALRLGLLHGTVCVGCCWLLMILLFVGGVMNLAWVAALAILVAVEKLASGGPLAARLAGVAMLLGGAGVLVEAY
ncbi:MAG: DUF2182 domain-containing protein [Sphingomonas bacterium]|nr:DUF2182 domain-containing protein [Sphingomonas bacterium]